MNGLLDKEDNKIQDDSDAKFNDGAAFDYDKEFNNIVDNELNDLNMRKTDEMSDPSGNGPKYNTSGGNGYDAGGSPTINVNFKAKYTVPLVAAGSLGMAGIIGFNTIAPGPAQFLQMGELLQDFHLKDSEEFTNSRATQAWRYARDPNNPQNRRLSELGKKHAAVLDTNMAKAGYTMEFDGRGQLKRMVIDTEKTGLDPEKTRAKYEKAGINAGNITPEGKTIYIDNLNNDGWHPFRNSDIFRSALIDSGYGDTVSRIHNRTLKKRAKLHYNPAKALTDYIDNKVKDFVGSQKEKAVAKKDAWVESRKTYTSDGADIAGFAADDKKGR